MTRKQKRLNKNLRKIRYTIAEVAANPDRHYIVASGIDILEAEALKQEGYVVKPRLDGSYSIIWQFEVADDFYFNNTRAKKEWREGVCDALVCFCPVCGQRLR